MDAYPCCGDSLGTALAFGDFNADGRDDLAMGAPGEQILPCIDEPPCGYEGGVSVVYGGRSGLTAAGNQFWRADALGRLAGMGTGAALASGDFDGDGAHDLAIGGPGTRGGTVMVLRGVRRGGLTTRGGQFWSQSSRGIPGTAESDDAFGGSLLVGQFGRGPHDDLVIGDPFERINRRDMTGRVHILFGSRAALTTKYNQVISQRTAGVAGAAEAGDSAGIVGSYANGWLWVAWGRACMTYWSDCED